MTARPIPVPVPTESGAVVLAAWDGPRAERRGTLLRRAATEALGASDPPLEIEAEVCPDCGERHGAPRAVGAAHPVFLSLAHAGSASAAAASTRTRIGIDAVRADAEVGGLAAILPGIGDPLRHWTRIEAVLKADGRGLRVEPDRIRFAENRMRAHLDGIDYLIEELTVDGILVTLAAARGAAS